MRWIDPLRICAAAAAIVAGNAQAAACDSTCGYGYYYAPPAYAYYAPPVYAYAPPPAHAYYGPRAYTYYAPSAYGYGDYYARIDAFRGPRWDYSAAYYRSPAVYGGYFRPYRAYGYYARPRVYARVHRSYVRGPFLRTWRRW